MDASSAAPAEPVARRPRPPANPHHRVTPWRSIALGCVLLLAASGACVAWFLSQVPPGCADPRTLALVRQSLLERFSLPATTDLVRIRTVAGGRLALRFVCQADLAGFDRNTLPAGPIPHAVDYTSRLEAGRHHVAVSIEPVLKWDKVD